MSLNSRFATVNDWGDNGRKKLPLVRMFYELLSRDHEDGCATRQPQGIGSEAYLTGTSQGEPVLSLSKEHPRTPGRAAISVVAASDS